jgi:hypothetical protein
MVICFAVWHVEYLPEAGQEYRAVPSRERRALDNAVAKLRTLGPSLGFPHSSAVQGATGLRELRPRAGRSPWRAFYRILADTPVIAAVGPEAEHDPRGFRRACRDATQRLNEREGGSSETR